MVEVCREFDAHDDRVARGRARIPDREAVLELSDLFAGLGNPTRLTVLFALTAGELCTCDLSGLTGLSVSAMSHQLRILKDRRLVSYRKDGKNVFYRLRDTHVSDLISVALAHAREGATHG